MLTVSITYCTVARKRWNWPMWRVVLVGILFMEFDVSFLVGNLPKLLAGGWVPAVIAVCIFTFFVTWVDGRRRFATALHALSTPVDEFLQEVRDVEVDRAAGTAVVLTPSTEGIPFALRHTWLRHEILHEHIVLMSIVNERRPYVPADERVTIAALGPSLTRVTAHYGFRQTPRIAQILALCRVRAGGGTFDDPIYYFLAHPHIVADRSPGAMRPWQRTLYDYMLRTARSFTDSLGLPPEQVVEFGVKIPV